MVNYLVSIITPTYNSGKFIADTISSIVNQTYENWELLITDDCSIDKTWEIINKYARKDNRIKVFRLKVNSGPGIARNNSIREAKGRFIAFCDSDDLWKPNKLEKQIEFMSKNNYALTFSNYDVINEEGRLLKDVNSPSVVDYRKMLKNNYIGCLTAIYDKKQLGIRFMTSLPKRQDWTLWLNILKSIPKAYNINENLAIYRKRNNSVSSNKLILLKYHYLLYHKIEQFSKTMSVILLIKFIYYYFIKKI